ncbi:MAG: hypothetical protein EBS05_08560 [Proteobacteria bacterium]|nr:hypothetical protein [Pseudomonadota bacterium]
MQGETHRGSGHRSRCVGHGDDGPERQPDRPGDAGAGASSPDPEQQPRSHHGSRRGQRISRQQLLAHCTELLVRTYIPERKQKHRRWTDKPVEYEVAFRANRRRVQSEKGRRLSRWRSERCERTFAPVCEAGGRHRTWLHGLRTVTKAHVLRCAAYDLGLLLRKVFVLDKLRSTGGLAPVVFWCYAVPDRRLTAPELFRSLQERLRTTHWRGGGNKSQILRLGVL